MLALILAFESRTGFAAMAPSSIASANMPDKQARAVLAAPGPLPHLEVETYTWGVLPDGPGGDDGLVEGLAAELAWTRDRLVALGAEEIR